MSTHIYRVLAVFILVASQISLGLPAAAAQNEAVQADLSLPPVGTSPSARQMVIQEDPLLQDIAAVAAGLGHTCALTTGGGVKCWGSNADGQLGDGTTTQHSTPVNVSGLASGVTALAAGGSHTCALSTGGGVKCWGRNYHGQLGDGTTTQRNTPVNVSGLASGVTALAAGDGHTCALTTGGGVKCWGSNWAGQLGDGTTTSRSTPVNVAGLASGVTGLAAGSSHTCALTTGGRVKCWGWNADGQLGDGTTTDRSTPVNVSGLASGVAALAAGYRHTCALTTGGGVKCWGNNGSGQLGDGTTTNRSTPVDVVGLASGVTVLGTGGYHTCALTTGARAKCWGENAFGQLGDGTTARRSTPVEVNGLASSITALAGGEMHSCALTTGRGVKCWGWNAIGQLGDGTTIWRSTPVDAVGLASGVTALAADGSHTCAVTAGGAAKCWGANINLQLGDGTNTNRSTPVDVVGLASGVAALAAGRFHTCALTTGGGAKCWGSNSDGQLGDGTTTNRSTPVDVVGLASGVTALAAGYAYTCALTTGGGVKCWGSNYHGQLGDGTTTNRSTPVNVSGLASGVIALVTGWSHTCALTIGGGVKCWGSNLHGQLGDGTTTNRSTPVDVVGLTGSVTALVAGLSYTCALTTGGGVKCWGWNSDGQLGDGTTTTRKTPVDVIGLSSGVIGLAAGSSHTCALTTGGGVKCWGRNVYGQLGDGTTTNRSTPVDVSGLASSVTALAAGDSHTCSLINQRPKCWGFDGYGQLGLGTPTQRLAPVDVVTSAARIRLNYVAGSPGSHFTLTGENFPAGLQATLSVNGVTLTSSLPVNAVGQFILFLSTADAGPGYYAVRVTAGASAMNAFVLDTQSPLRPQEGGGTTLAVPAGIAVTPRTYYLPLVQSQAIR